MIRAVGLSVGTEQREVGGRWAEGGGAGLRGRAEGDDTFPCPKHLCSPPPERYDLRDHPREAKR